ncbi:MAG: 1,4-dihydroxy-2-naphthoate polyprenyltransferase [Candidatus Omnitrophica bacterium]|nr:1,4-dihydroxy-2-naphthoate polyprenyltransferase [Candidatus Omnitrophota bacterium]
MSNVSLKTWLLAFRPKTLPAAIAPVMIATAMAFGDGVQHFPIACICLLAALSIQIGTNIANDYYDFKKGTDTIERIGPTRMTQAGLIKPSSMKLAFIVSFAIAIILGLWLIKRGGWPIAVIGILAIFSGIFYTAGPYPLGYIGLGEFFVLIFFGPVAVAGTYYVQSHEMNSAVVLAGIAPGLISVAILTVNNLRDIDSDRKAGKRTLAVRFGRSFAVYEFLFSIIAASLIPVLIYYLIEDHKAILACTCLALISIPTIKTVLTTSDGPSLNDALAKTGRLLMIYSILFSIGWIL